MFTGSKKPYTAITVQVDRLTSEQYEENDLAGIPELVEVIRLQDSGPTEAARALRKKLKYGNMHRQLRALTILDGLIDNAGTRFQRTFADEPLLERLRLMPRDDLVDPDVRKKCNTLYRQWAAAYKSTQGLQQIATLYKQLPKTNKTRPQPSQSRAVRETEAEAAHETLPSEPISPTHARKPSSSAPSSSSSKSYQSNPVSLGTTSGSSSFFGKSKDKKGKPQKFDLEKSKAHLLETIASANMASTNLLNGLKLINRENQRVSDNPECKTRFDRCKAYRRQILRYIQLVESEQYIGSLLSANDELVKALMAYEVMDKSIDDDSDSDAEYEASKAAFQRRTSGGQQDIERDLAGLNMDQVAVSAPPKPPRPMSIGMPPPVPGGFGKAPARPTQHDDDEDEEDDDDPFADRNAVKTPHIEKSGLTWRDV